MLKFIFILSLAFYVVFKLVGWLFRALSHNMGGLDGKGARPYRKTPRGSNVKIDFIPQKGKKRKKYKGGEYVDYEEVKHADL